MQSALNATNFYTSYAPTVDWTDYIGNQAAALHEYMGARSIGSNAYVVAHSMGGLTSRQLTRLRIVQGVVTIGTPHQGAQVANGYAPVFTKNGIAWTTNLGAHLALNDFVQNGNWEDPLWGRAANALNNIDVSLGAWTLAFGAFTDLQLSAHSSLTDLAPGSTFLNTLNSTESSVSVSHRKGIISELADGYMGGPLALVESASAANMHGSQIQLMAALAGVDAIAFVMEENSELDLGARWSASAALGDYSYNLATFSDWWTYSIVGNYPHDGLIPTSSQAYPQGGSPQYALFPHTSETTDVTQLLAVLDSWTR